LRPARISEGNFQLDSISSQIADAAGPDHTLDSRIQSLLEEELLVVERENRKYVTDIVNDPSHWLNTPDSCLTFYQKRKGVLEGGSALPTKGSKNLGGTSDKWAKRQLSTMWSVMRDDADVLKSVAKNTQYHTDSDQSRIKNLDPQEHLDPF
jgi:hypothetical protein